MAETIAEWRGVLRAFLLRGSLPGLRSCWVEPGLQGEGCGWTVACICPAHLMVLQDGFIACAAASLILGMHAACSAV
jgi:hypothetical protein